MVEKIIIINGKPRAGKDTFVKCWNIHCNKPVLNYSTVGRVKELAKMMGWNGVKDDKSRKFLSDIKKLWTDYNDGIFKELCSTINKNPNSYIFIHCREPEEIKKFKDKYGKLCTTLFIDKDVEVTAENYSDMNVSNYNYDLIVENNGTVADLELKIIEMLSK